VKCLSHVIFSISWFLPSGNNMSYNACSVEHSHALNLASIYFYKGSRAVEMFKVVGRHPMTPSQPPV
jgi:hypothetical protein